MKRRIVWSGLLGLLTAGGLLAAPEPNWPAAARFRVAVEPREAAGSYEILLDHHGLAWPDARDVRVFNAVGQPLSSAIVFSDAQHARVLWDGQGGPGVYHIYFGDGAAEVPPLPSNRRLAAGRPEWRPTGGFECTTYKSARPQAEWRDKLSDMKSVLDLYAALRAAAEPQQARLDQLTAEERVKEVPFVLREVYPDTAVALPVDPGENAPGPDGKPVRLADRFMHRWRLTVNLPTAGNYQFVVGEPNALKVLVADGNTGAAAVRGWYEFGFGSWNVNQRIGEVQLAAGRHVLELYTFLSTVDLKVRIGEGQVALEAFDGRFAAFDDTVTTVPGPLQSAGGKLDEDCFVLLEHLRNRSASAAVRVAARGLRSLFADRPDVVRRLDEAAEAALLAMDERLWTMEGKYPARTGAVVDAPYFAPPFKLARQSSPRSFHDWAGLGGPLWLDSGMQYGLDCEILRDAWCLTSGACYQDGLLYLGLKNGKFCGVDLARQSARWVFPGEGPCYGSPLVYRGAVYYGSIDARLYALDAARGRMLWNFPTRGWIEGSPAAAGDRIYFGSEDAHVYAVDAALGVERWSTGLDGPITGTPACAGDRVFIGTRGGHFYALEGATGAIAWAYSAGAPIEGGSCVGAGRVAFGDRAGFVHCLDVSNGQLVWSRPCQVSGPVTAAPILVGDVLYGGTADGSAYWGIDLAAGQVGWTMPVVDGGDVHRPALFVADHLVFVARNRGAGKETHRQSLVDLVMADAPPVECRRAAEPIAVDGQLSEVAWASAARLPVFARRNGMAIGDPVAARMVWDEEAVYLAVTRQSDPQSDQPRLLMFFDGVQRTQAVVTIELAADGTRTGGVGPLIAQSFAQGSNVSWEVTIPQTNFPAPAFAAGRPTRFNLMVAAGADEAATNAWHLVPSASTNTADLRWMEVRFVETVGEAKP